MSRRDGLRPLTLLVVALAVGVLSAVLWGLVVRGGRLVPPPPLLAGVLVLVLGGFVLWWSWPVRRYVRGRARQPLDPVRAARTLALAQAGGLTGAATAGWYGGQLVVVLADLDLVANHGRAWRLAGFTLLGVALAGAGLLAQRWCRVDRPPEE